MKPFDGGQWVGVSRVGSPEELRARYDESGERMMHLQTALEGFDVFVRSLSIGAETMSMWFDPSQPMHDRYQVKHDFLTPELGDEIISISRLVNAFFRWEFNSCETIVKDGVAYPIDYANASPDVALTSLHYYFPWAITALVRWCAFCARHAPRDAHQPELARLLRRAATATICPTRRSSRSTASSPTSTSRSTPTGSSATRTWRTWTSSRMTWFTSPAFDDVLVAHGALDVPGARARPLRRALPRPARGVGARQRLSATDRPPGRVIRSGLRP